MTILDLSKKLRVSTATISRALNPLTAHLVAAPVRGRIQDYAKKNHFMPNQAARNLVQGRTRTLGVILYSAFGSLFFSDYLAKVQWGITEALGEQGGYGCKIVILPRGKDLNEMDHHVIGTGVDGLLISTICDFTLERIQNLAYTVERRWDKPIVALNIGTLPKSRISTVSFSNREAAYKAVTHLLQNGHERIGMIYTEDSSMDVRERVEAYRAALESHHFAYDPKLISQGYFTPESGYHATIELFKREESASITALFCTNDEMAFGAIKALRVLRKRCPQDVAVIGFDGLDMGEQTVPRLSTVAQPFFEIAKAGTKLLLDLVEGRRREPIHLNISSQLIIRDSA